MHVIVVIGWEYSLGGACDVHIWWWWRRLVGRKSCRWKRRKQHCLNWKFMIRSLFIHPQHNNKIRRTRKCYDQKLYLCFTMLCRVDLELRKANLDLHIVYKYFILGKYLKVKLRTWMIEVAFVSMSVRELNCLWYWNFFVVDWFWSEWIHPVRKFLEFLRQVI